MRLFVYYYTGSGSSVVESNMFYCYPDTDKWQNGSGEGLWCFASAATIDEGWMMGILLFSICTKATKPFALDL